MFEFYQVFVDNHWITPVADEHFVYNISVDY